MRYEKYGRFWAVYDAAGQLVCLAVYKKGAREVLRRLSPVESQAIPVTQAPRQTRLTGKRGTQEWPIQEN